MSTVVRDVDLVVSVLLTLPIVAVAGFAIFDIVRRRDLPVLRKVVYGVVVVAVFPATLLYLLSRPTSIVRHRERGRSDWREELVARLEWTPGRPPVVGPRQEQLLAQRVAHLRSPSVAVPDDGSTGRGT